MKASVDDYQQEYTRKVLDQRGDHLEAMIAAYYRLTDIPPDQVVLCEQFKDGVTRWWIERRAIQVPLGTSWSRIEDVK